MFHCAFSSSGAVDFILPYLGLFFLLNVFLHPMQSACAVLMLSKSPHFLFFSIFKTGLGSSSVPVGSICHHCHLHQIFSW